MTLTEWFITFIIVQCLHGLATWKLYIKANRQAWEAFVPVYNAVILMKIISRPWWWTILLFVPIVNLVMLPVVWVETARSFGKNSTQDTLLAAFTLGFYNFYLSYFDTNVNYVKNRSLKPKSSAGEWVSSILFAIVAATLVHTYFMQPFTIPTSSLEKTLLVGDFLFVSKFHYGARVPMTTVAAPMVHDTIPGLKKKSYLADLELPYMRLPGFQKIKRNDIVVFNWPVDTMLDMRHTDKYYYKPIDKKTNYVKRCTAIAGDTLEIRNGYVYINGQKNQLPGRAKIQFSYDIQFKGQLSSTQEVYRILNRYDMTDGLGYDEKNGTYIIPAATEENVARAKNHPNIESITIRKQDAGVRDAGIFPSDALYNWNNDNFGPLYIPKKGSTVNLTVENLPLYKYAIRSYEGHEVKVKGNQITIDGEVANSFTFTKDYYWMMGDNRHNSQDSRVWGFVPFDHVVGKPVFIWMSIDQNQKGIKKFRFDRFFTTVSGDDTPKSYLIHFFVLLILGIAANKYYKKRKAEAA
ncbi:MAG: signal peptidase I [Bacteroidetes bacterium MedPE-SWsnd-G2]|nr:MAG: signal peptidase I [Bacteroidetes bacterium MedPE-SWsnd-G2]